MAPDTSARNDRTASTSQPDVVFGEEVMMSGLKGKALESGKKWPTKQEVFDVIPKRLLKRDTAKSMFYAVQSLVLTLACGWAGTFIPATPAWAPAWALYAAVTGAFPSGFCSHVKQSARSNALSRLAQHSRGAGSLAGTVATGMWVVAHECGHRAFSDNTKLQDAVGYVFHTLLMVPYFSWQRSHAVHHARTNHLTEGETHVPYAVSDNAEEFYTVGEAKLAKRARYFAEGKKLQFGINRLWSHLVFGWPAYIISGATGGPIRGKTSHFDPTKGTQGRNALFPGKFADKVYWSDYGIAAMVAGLVAWGAVAGWQAPALLYGLPLAVTNMWLVLYTWLQHTDVDVPHFDRNDWTWSKGTFMTIDRPYGPLFNWLHHGIGSTHVVHHINDEIPHYNAWEATEKVKEAFPDLYLFDPTPVHEALWRVSTHCVAVEKKEGDMGAWVFNTKAE